MSSLKPYLPPYEISRRRELRTLKRIIKLYILAVLVILAISLLIAFRGSAETPRLQDTVLEQSHAVEAPQGQIKPIYEGVASYYSFKIGDWDSSTHYVCAARDFPRWTKIKVTNVDNGKTSYCVIDDFGPDYSVFPKRIVDLSPQVFNEISNTKLGLFNVKIEEL